MGGDLRHSEQGLAIRAPMTILELLLMIQEGRALHEERRERGHPEVDHSVDRVRAATLVGKPFQASSQRVQEGRQNAHPLLESDTFPPANPFCANRVKKSHSAQVATKPVVQPENLASPQGQPRLTSIHIENCRPAPQPLDCDAPPRGSVLVHQMCPQWPQHEQR
jgi:hypothetical protein